MTNPAHELWDVDINMFTALTRLCPPAKAPESCHMDPWLSQHSPPLLSLPRGYAVPTGTCDTCETPGVGGWGCISLKRFQGSEQAQNVCSGWWTRSGVTSCEGLV